LNRFNDKVVDRTLKHLNRPANALFLDAGCGMGDHSMRIAERGFRCVGVDLSETVLVTARKNAAARGLASRTSFVCQALEDLTFNDDTFDAVHCRGVLMHVPQWERALASLCRVLKPGGRIAILEGNHKSLEMAIVLAVRKVQARNSKMIKTEAGFEFWSQKNGHPFVVRIANIQRLTSALEANQTRVLKTLAHEFWDINRFPAGALRNAVMRYNYVYFLLGLPRFGCIGNAIIAEKQAAS
jgi:ubiquinone/menaquinone biosynthesis C-methylase UbiE